MSAGRCDIPSRCRSLGVIMMLVAPQSTIARMHCISPFVSGVCIFSSRIAISACAVNTFGLLSVERSSALDLLVAAIVIISIAVGNIHMVGGFRMSIILVP